MLKLDKSSQLILATPQFYNNNFPQINLYDQVEIWPWIMYIIYLLLRRPHKFHHMVHTLLEIIFLCVAAVLFAKCLPSSMSSADLLWFPFSKCKPKYIKKSALYIHCVVYNMTFVCRSYYVTMLKRLQRKWDEWYWIFFHNECANTKYIMDVVSSVPTGC